MDGHVISAELNALVLFNFHIDTLSWFDGIPISPFLIKFALLRAVRYRYFLVGDSVIKQLKHFLSLSLGHLPVFILPYHAAIDHNLLEHLSLVLALASLVALLVPLLSSGFLFG